MFCVKYVNISSWPRCTGKREAEGPGNEQEQWRNVCHPGPGENEEMEKGRVRR